MSEVKTENENEDNCSTADSIIWSLILAAIIIGFIAFITYLNDVWEKPRFLYNGEQNSAIQIIDKLSIQVKLGNYEFGILKNSYLSRQKYIKVLGLNITSRGGVIDAESNVTYPFTSLKDEYQRDVYDRAVEIDRRNGINKIFSDFEVEVIEVVQ